MGVSVSDWTLARTVSRLGQIGVVSGTALGAVLARRLQWGDPGGHHRRALSHFPFPEMAERILNEYFIPGGKPPGTPFRLTAMPNLRPRSSWTELTVAANFTEVFLAKEGHDGRVGVNYLEKIQLPTLPSLFGAMLAGVDYVLMGAGIPRSIPGALDRMAAGESAVMGIDVIGAEAGDSFVSEFDPRAFGKGRALRLKRPLFLAIVGSAVLAMTLAKKSNGTVDGFVVEGPTAGGHNAPPRGPMQLSPAGEPVYGSRDVPELHKIAALGLPFWLAGSYGRPGKLAEALALGAAGIQVGTAFAFCEESGVMPELRRQAVRLSREGKGAVFTDPLASPAGFPFKVAQMPGTLSEEEIYLARPRICDLGYLRRPYRRADGTLGYRCPAEPAAAFLRKGGAAEEMRGRKCICNGLAATAGIGQTRNGQNEPPLVTAGDDMAHIAEFLKPGCDTYTAADVVERLLAPA